WAPVLESSEPVFIYVSGYQSEGPLASDASLTDLHRFERVGFADALALADISSFFGSRKKTFKVRYQTLGRLDELKDGPAVLIGAFNNTWALRLTGQLRFSFVRDPDTHTSWIQDRENPQSRKWAHRMDVPFSSLSEDYGIVSRVWDPTTGK